jgi:hypothetical protein
VADAFLHCISISTDNASVNDVVIATVARILLAKYGIPSSPNLHIRCFCHVINLVVQAILAALGEADDPDDVDYYSLNKEQPFHLDIDTDPDQVALDDEEFDDDVEEEFENITLEEEEKPKATESPLSKVCFSNFVTYTALNFVLAALHNKQGCIDTSTTKEVSAVRNGQVFHKELESR